VPGTDTAGDGSDVGEVRRGDDVFRVVRQPFWDAVARVADMDRHRVDVQVVSPIPVAITYWAEPREALRFARAQNDEIAAMVDGSAGRLIGLGTVPLQDADLAAAELTRLTGELGLAGAEIGTVVCGRELDDPSLRPFFRAAAERGVPLFLHPIDGSGVLRCSSPLVDFALGMHADSALAATALVYGGVVRELPELRVCLSHGGGSFPWTHPRLRLLRTNERRQLDDDVARLWADCLVFDPLHLPLLLSRYGPGHVVLGSDYPFIPPQMHDPRQPLAEAVEAGIVDPVVAGQIRGPNALAFLGLPFPLSRPVPASAAR
jgi:aminocarboxymuconate-semialdehyde decarboxylase